MIINLNESKNLNYHEYHIYLIRISIDSRYSLAINIDELRHLLHLYLTVIIALLILQAKQFITPKKDNLHKDLNPLYVLSHSRF